MPMNRCNQAITFFLVTTATLTFCVVSSFSVSNQQPKNAILSNVRLDAQQQHQEESGLDNLNQPSRRSAIGSFFKSLVIGATAIGTTSTVGTQVVTAADDSNIESVYFGVGCFWHIQHEFIAAEKIILQRSNQELSSKAGYAGGTATDREGRVCYHNIMGVADYGKLGHGEVVGMDLPKDKIVDFSAIYFSLFDPKTKG